MKEEERQEMLEKKSDNFRGVVLTMLFLMLVSQGLIYGLLFTKFTGEVMSIGTSIIIYAIPVLGFLLVIICKLANTGIEAKYRKLRDKK